MAQNYERVHFRYIQMHCCKHQLCWVNPRLPTYCPECGTLVYPEVRADVVISDTNAGLRYKGIDDGQGDRHTLEPLNA